MLSGSLERELLSYTKQKNMVWATLWIYVIYSGHQITDYENYFVIFQDKHYHVVLSKWKASAKTPISGELGIFFPWFSVESNALGKRAIEWDSISNEDLLLCVNLAGCPVMLPLQTWRSTQPGTIMQSYIKKQIHIIWKTLWHALETLYCYWISVAIFAIVIVSSLIHFISSDSQDEHMYAQNDNFVAVKCFTRVWNQHT